MVCALGRDSIDQAIVIAIVLIKTGKSGVHLLQWELLKNAPGEWQINLSAVFCFWYAFISYLVETSC